MNVFISYSIQANEQYILSLLAQKLAETGLMSVTSYDQGSYVDIQAINDIKNSVLFIGLITHAGGLAKVSRVFSEFKQANLLQKPAILLIEEGVEVAPWVSIYQNTIRFNRYNIEQAITEVNRRIQTSPNPQANQNALAWILGGLGVLALLSLLSSDKK